MSVNHTPTNAPEQDLSRFSVKELEAIQETLREATTDEALVSVALSFLRFAKLRGGAQDDGWMVQIAVNGVIRKWPGCGGMKYKPLIDSLKKCGLIEVTRNKRQSSNGTGRPRTYLIRVQPELRTGAAMSHEEALQFTARSVRAVQAADMKTLSPVNNVNTYRRSIPPTSSEEMRKKKEEAGQECIQVKNRSMQLGNNSPDADPMLNRFRQAESARLATLCNKSISATLTRPLTVTRSNSDIRQSSGPMDQMVTTVQIPVMRVDRGQWPRRFRQWHRPRQDVESAPVTTSLMSSDRSNVSIRSDSQQQPRSDSHEYAGLIT